MTGLLSSERPSTRGQRTRSAILSAGQALFARRAMDSVTIDEIVTAAEVAKGSFYNHFDDKEELASAIAEQVQSDCEVQITAANAGVEDAAARIVRALCVMISYAAAHPERLQALLSLSERRTIASTPLNAGVASDVAQGLAAGRFSGVTVEAGVVMVIGLIRITVAHAIAERSSTPAAELSAMIGLTLLRGLGVADAEAAALARDASQDLLQREARP